MTPQYKAMMKKLRSNTVKETTQATRNIRKYKRKIETAPKGRIVTDDYGNKLSVKKKTDGTFGRRHTLSQGVKRAIRLGGVDITEGLAQHKKMIKYGSNQATLARRHATSASRRFNMETNIKGDKNAIKSDYHSTRATPNSGVHKAAATTHAKNIHGTKRKPKDFTK